VPLGESHFQVSGSIDPDSLMFQAKKVGADVVLFRSVYLGSYQSAVPLLQYNPGTTSTTYSSGTVNANAYGNGGYAYGTGNYYGSSTTTTPGTFSTQVVPVTMSRYQYDAIFWRKRHPPILGVLPIPLTEEIRKILERNTGVLIAKIIDDSPAFRANLLEGDVILSFAGEDVISPSDFAEKTELHKGQKVDIGIWRNGELKTISVQLDSP
jgi:PDZ domain